MRKVEWPARLQNLTQGALAKSLGPQWELWLDGGHNDLAGEALGAQAQGMERGELTGVALHLFIFGMLTTKTPAEFLHLLAPHVASLYTVSIPGEAQSFSAEDLPPAAYAARRASLPKNTAASDGVRKRSAKIKIGTAPGGAFLIGGSLYLAGSVLRLNEARRDNKITAKSAHEKPPRGKAGRGGFLLSVTATTVEDYFVVVLSRAGARRCRCSSRSWSASCGEPASCEAVLGGAQWSCPNHDEVEVLGAHADPPASCARTGPATKSSKHSHCSEEFHRTHLRGPFPWGVLVLARFRPLLIGD